MQIGQVTIPATEITCVADNAGTGFLVNNSDGAISCILHMMVLVDTSAFVAEPAIYMSKMAGTPRNKGGIYTIHDSCRVINVHTYLASVSIMCVPII